MPMTSSITSYTGKYTANGRESNTQFCHIWGLDGGKVKSFQQYTDTYQWRRTSGTLEE